MCKKTAVVLSSVQEDSCCPLKCARRQPLDCQVRKHTAFVLINLQKELCWPLKCAKIIMFSSSMCKNTDVVLSNMEKDWCGPLHMKKEICVLSNKQKCSCCLFKVIENVQNHSFCTLKCAKHSCCPINFLKRHMLSNQMCKKRDVVLSNVHNNSCWPLDYEEENIWYPLKFAKIQPMSS